mgnify:CR=1 FL=1
MGLTRDTLREFLGTKLGLSVDDITDETALLSSGLLDSFSVVQLLVFIEESSGVQLAPTDVGFATLDSIERIMAYISGAESK